MDLLTRRWILGLGATLLVLASAAVAGAQTHEARGQVISVSDSSLSVKTATQTLTFVVEPGTLVEAHGAGTRSRQAEAAGKSAGIKVTDYVKAGGNVLVTYRQASGKNVAVNIRPVSSAGGAAESNAAPVTKNVQGKVKSISGSSLTIDENGRDVAFIIDRDTDVFARGATRATRQAGGKLAITDIVHTGDIVRVAYRDVNGSMKASEVQVRAAGTIPAK